MRRSSCSKNGSFLEWKYANKINKGQRPCLQQESLLQAPELRGLPRLDKQRREHFTLPLELVHWFIAAYHQAALWLRTAHSIVGGKKWPRSPRRQQARRAPAPPAVT